MKYHIKQILPVGIQRYILGRALIASSQVDRLQLAVEG
jgi:hypothetical protein